MSTAQTIGQRAMGEDAPKLAQLTDEVLFGDIWNAPSSRNGTVASLLWLRWWPCTALNSCRSTSTGQWKMG